MDSFEYDRGFVPFLPFSVVVLEAFHGVEEARDTRDSVKVVIIIYQIDVDAWLLVRTGADY